MDSALVALCLALIWAELASAADVPDWKPKGVSSPQFESHAGFDPLNPRLLLRPELPEIRGLADPRHPLRVQGLVEAGAAFAGEWVTCTTGGNLSKRSFGAPFSLEK